MGGGAREIGVKDLFSLAQLCAPDKLHSNDDPHSFCTLILSLGALALVVAASVRTMCSGRREGSSSLLSIFQEGRVSVTWRTHWRRGWDWLAGSLDITIQEIDGATESRAFREREREREGLCVCRGHVTRSEFVVETCPAEASYETGRGNKGCMSLVTLNFSSVSAVSTPFFVPEGLNGWLRQLFWERKKRLLGGCS